MAAVDGFAINNIGIPGAVLMEQAGKSVAEICLSLLKGNASKKAIVLCGSGNNGGDGFVVARHLLHKKIDVKVVLLGALEKLQGDAKLNADVWQKLDQKILFFENFPESEYGNADLLVDAMLGTGSRGGLRGAYAKAAMLVNQSPANVVAVDLPTGVDADSGEVDENAIKADVTVTFGAAKPGLLFSPGRECAGNLHVADIGFPPKAFASVHPKTWLLPAGKMGALLPDRHPADFKNKCGQIFIVAGSEGMAGAASLASSAAVRVGAGLVVLATAPTIVAQLAAHPVEVVKEPLHWQEHAMTGESRKRLHTRLQWAHAVAIGPGLGQSAEAKFWLEEILHNYHGPLIIDADGLNLLQGRVDILKKRQGETVVTPHPGEFLRLSGLQKDDLKPVPIEIAREFATHNNVHLLLKGAPSLLAFADGRVYINSAGNPGMATAGMGDVLTGAIIGLAGQMPLPQAALLGMFIHSRAADIAIKSIDPLSLTAGDVISHLSQTFMELRNLL